MNAFNSIKEVLLFLRDNIVSAERNGERALSIKCGDNDAANEMIRAFQRLYPNVKDIEFHVFGWDKWAYPRFESNEDREDALDLIERLQRGEKVEVETVVSTVGPSGVKETNKTTTIEEDDDDRDKESTDWVTYLVVGAAAVVILLLLWDSKKK